ncbi:MAG: amidohydrolase, partial [Catenulispora sp.]
MIGAPLTGAPLTGAAAELAAAIDELPLVDHHVHGVVRDDVDRAGFENLIAETYHPNPPGVTAFDSQVGFAVRRWCAPVLGLEPHAAPDEYLTRRAELGPDEVNRRLLRASGIGTFLIDTGYSPVDVLGPAAMAAAAGGTAREIVRLEAVAE